MQATPAVYNNVLRVHRIRLDVRLGYEKEERAQPQYVEIDLDFYTPDLAEPALIDKGDFICYDKISRALEETCRGREFHLIEYLCKQVFEVVRARVPEDTKIAVKLTKCKILVPFVLGGASFSYTDLPPFSWTPPI